MSECASDECCYYHEGPMVASKKRQAAILPFAGMVQGLYACKIPNMIIHLNISTCQVWK